MTKEKRSSNSVRKGRSFFPRVIHDMYDCYGQGPGVTEDITAGNRNIHGHNNLEKLKIA